MPELPEVEIMTRNARRWTRGRQLLSISLPDPRLLKGHTEADLARLHNTSFGPVHRRGKYLILNLDRHSLILHFKMTGKLVCLRADETRKATRLRMNLSGERTLIFDDARHLGQIWLRPSSEIDRFFEERGLGPEPWPQQRSPEWWAACLDGRGAVKMTLMNQRRIAGLGNIAASEICWRARVDPRQRADSLSAEQHQRLTPATHAYIEHTLDTESSDEITYINSGGPNSFKVYGRQDEPCPRCSSPIQRWVQSGRATFWCPPCQASPASG